MPRVAYIDIIGGISGDMLISAMIDAGLPIQQLEAELRKIVPKPFHLKTTKTQRGSIKATHTDVLVGDENTPRLGWSDFYARINNSTLTEPDRQKIQAIFDCLRDAEAKAHNAPDGETHLHELGTLDTLIDFASAVIGMRLLGVSTIYSSPITASTGFSSSSHGIAPSIAPATSEIITRHNIPIRIGGSNQPRGESTTPTGAAIIATLATFKPANITVETIGYGAGTRDTDNPPNVLGLWLGQPTQTESDFRQAAETIGLIHQNDVIIIEVNIDDMTGEEIGYAISELFDIGALDVWTTPIQMKKSRPAVTISIIANQSDLNTITAAIFTHTSTLGIRVRQLDRLIAHREIITVETEFGPIRVKLRKINGITTHIAPEYDDCAQIATQNAIPLQKVIQAAQKAATQTT